MNYIGDVFKGNLPFLVSVSTTNRRFHFFRKPLKNKSFLEQFDPLFVPNTEFPLTNYLQPNTILIRDENGWWSPNKHYDIKNWVDFHLFLTGHATIEKIQLGHFIIQFLDRSKHAIYFSTVKTRKMIEQLDFLTRNLLFFYTFIKAFNRELKEKIRTGVGVSWIEDKNSWKLFTRGEDWWVNDQETLMPLKEVRKFLNEGFEVKESLTEDNYFFIYHKNSVWGFP